MFVGCCLYAEELHCHEQGKDSAEWASNDLKDEICPNEKLAQKSDFGGAEFPQRTGFLNPGH
jgi:hypothetical protein